MRTRIAHPSALLLLTAIASAQTDLSSRLRPITAPVRDAGVYHVATDTWTRGELPSAALGTQVIYDNTCVFPLFGAQLPGETFTDEGRVPSASSPDNLVSKPGCSTAGCPEGYGVDGFEIGYCTDAGPLPSGEQVVMTFYCAYFPCDSRHLWASEIAASFSVAGLPSSPAVGSTACWIVTLDLLSPPQSTHLGFELGADGDGAYGTTDTFGWSMEYPNTTGNTGPVVAGDPANCSRWGNTIWDPVQPSPETRGTGMGTENSFRIDGVPTNPGCSWFGVGTPMASFHLRLFSSDACDLTTPGIASSCFGAPASCPCGATDQAGTDGLGGCDASFGTGGSTLELHSASAPSVGADSIASPQVGARVTRGPTTGSTHLLFQGTVASQVAFGDGLRCAGGDVLRLGVRSFGAAGGFPDRELRYLPGDFGVGLPLALAGAVPAGGGIRAYQGLFRDSATFCTPTTFNLTNAVEVTWLP